MTSRWIPVLLCIAFGWATASDARSQDPDRPTNVIIMYMDGMGLSGWTLARQFAQAQGDTTGFTIDDFVTATVTTAAVGEYFTGSATSATAYATGYNTARYRVGMTVGEQPVATVMEAAKWNGWRTGIVSSAKIVDASPAAFSAHVPHRYDFADRIAEHQIHLSSFDLIMGGGRQHFLPQGAGGSRADGRDLTAEASDRGYALAMTPEAFLTSTGLPMLALFTDDVLGYEIDRTDDVWPDMETMTRKSLDLLSASGDPVFLFVETEGTDDAGHSNDAALLVREVIAYDRAISAAREFADANPGTLVLVLSDHETGGLAIGRRRADGRSIEAWRPAALAGATLSIRTAVDRAGREHLVSGDAPDLDAAYDFLTDRLGLDSLSTDEADRIRAAVERAGAEVTPERPRHAPLEGVLRAVVAERAGLDWSTNAHSGTEVMMYAHGTGAERFGGRFTNDEVGRLLFDVLGFNRAAETERLKKKLVSLQD